MKAVLCTAYGEPDDLVVQSVPSPTVGKGKIKIAIHAAGVNFPDILMIQGKYQFKPPFPFSPGLEAAGEVLEVGAGVNLFKPGDRVMVTCGFGGFAEEVVAEEKSVFALPDGVEYVSAAGFPVTYGTSYHALVDRAKLQPGEVLLVHGAAGGVGLTAVELGKLMGASVIATVGADEKFEVVKRYGADHVINYNKENFRDRVLDITDKKGADVIYDPVGGDVFDLSMRCIAWEGRLLVIGFASGRIPELSVNRALLKGCQVVGVFWGSFAQRTPDRNREHFKILLDWCAEGKLKPHVSHTYPLDEAADALKMLLSRKATGKLVIKVR